MCHNAHTVQRGLAVEEHNITVHEVTFNNITNMQRVYDEFAIGKSQFLQTLLMLRRSFVNQI